MLLFALSHSEISNVSIWKNKKQRGKQRAGQRVHERAADFGNLGRFCLEGATFSPHLHLAEYLMAKIFTSLKLSSLQ